MRVVFYQNNMLILIGPCVLLPIQQHRPLLRVVTSTVAPLDGTMTCDPGYESSYISISRITLINVPHVTIVPFGPWLTPSPIEIVVAALVKLNQHLLLAVQSQVWLRVQPFHLPNQVCDVVS